MRIKLKELAQVIGGEIRQGNPELLLNGVSTDSREIGPRNIFFALKGEKFDGHKFVSEVAKKQAGTAVVKKGFQQILPKNFGLVEVSEPLYALGELARYQRARLKIKIIGITGSVGKTTTKEMIALVLSRKFKTAKTKGNFNNLIGVPLTIFQIPLDAEVAVLELASNQPGEIARLSEIVQPDLGVITKIAEAHLEGFKDLEGVLKEKRALVSALGTRGTFIFNLSDPRLCRLALGFAGEKVGFGLNGKNFKDALMLVLAKKVQVKKQEQEFIIQISGKLNERAKMNIAGLGKHLIENALSAVAVGRLLGVSLKECGEALKYFQPLSGRGQLEKIQDQLYLIDESYNANPASMKQALEVFEQLTKRISGKKILVLGEMKELGNSSAQAHLELGEFLRKISFDQMYYYGGFQRELRAGLGKELWRKVSCPQNLEELKMELNSGVGSELKQGLILVKASHIMGLSEIASYLREKFGEGRK